MKYSWVEINVQKNDLNSLSKLGIAIDHAAIYKDKIEVVLSEEELNLVDINRFDYKILENDLSSYFESRISSHHKNSNFLFCDEIISDTVTVPDQFNLGSMGGYLTYNEMLQELDSMAMNYPDLITVKQQIDTFLTEENRPIYVVKISDNPHVDESSIEDQMLYSSLHHAREPISMMQLIFYMEYLLENYNKNEKIKFIIDNLELYFVPCVNPDGYVYNETTNPNGGGLWRKNRRDNLDGTFGVDLNRNYGFDWGVDDIGSSPTTSSFTYRGPYPFSEPETKAMKYLCELKEFKTTLNYHSFGNVLITPEVSAEDSSRYINFSEKIAQHNHYTYGTGLQTLGYTVNGDSDSWMYRDITNKLKQYSFTSEVGNNTDNFWPAIDRIIPLCKENLLANVNAALIIGDYVSVERVSEFSTEKTDAISLDLQRFGLEDISNSTIKIVESEYFKNMDSQRLLGSFQDLEVKNVIFNYELADDVVESTKVPFEIELTLDGNVHNYIIYRIFSTQQPIYSEKYDLNLTDWNLSLWGSTDEYFVSPPYSITDSPYDNYRANLDNELVLNKTINFGNPDFKAAYMKFNAKWETEDGYDYLQLIIDDGVEEKPLCGNYTNLGVGNTGQPEGEPLYDGIQKQWVEEYINLDDYLGKVFEIKFVMKSDAALQMDGFYIDNFKIFALKEEGVGVYKELEIMDNLVDYYPNPVKDKLFIRAVKNDNLVLKITTVLGEVIEMEYEKKEGNIVVNVSHLKKGIYNVSLLNQNEIISTSHFVKF